MAIEYKVKGKFELTDNLKQVLLEALGDLAREEVPEMEGMVFWLWVPTVSVTGFRSVRRDERAMLFFRVLDKERVVEAIDLIIQCVGALFREIKGDLSFWKDELLLLRRRGHRLRFYEPSKAKDRPFWTAPRRQLMEGPAIAKGRLDEQGYLAHQRAEREARGEYWNARQVAEFLGLSELTVKRMARKGQFPAVKVGRGWKFSPEGVRAWKQGEMPQAGRGSGLKIVK